MHGTWRRENEVCPAGLCCTPIEEKLERSYGRPLLADIWLKCLKTESPISRKDAEPSQGHCHSLMKCTTLVSGWLGTTKVCCVWRPQIQRRVWTGERGQRHGRLVKNRLTLLYSQISIAKEPQKSRLLKNTHEFIFTRTQSSGLSLHLFKKWIHI